MQSSRWCDLPVPCLVDDSAFRDQQLAWRRPLPVVYGGILCGNVTLRVRTARASTARGERPSHRHSTRAFDTPQASLQAGKEQSGAL